MAEFSHVTFGYESRFAALRGGRPVLEDFSLSVPEGARLCLQGPSGCGKTTVLRLAMGLERPWKGKISGLEGLAFSAVFQEDRLLPQKTVLENTALFSTAAEAEMLLRQLGLGDALQALPAELSGGMRRRAALARALAHPFEILILDEAFTGLDDTAKGISLAAVKERLTGKTFLMATHDPAEAETLGAEFVTLR